MGKTRCVVPGCKSGSYSERKRRKIEGKANLSLFLPPRNPGLFEKWKEALSLYRSDLCQKDPICELHFPEEDIDRFFVTKIRDGSIHKMEKKPALRTGAIPCIFPNISEDKENEPSGKKIPLKQYSQVPDPKESLVSTVSHVSKNLDAGLPKNLSRNNSELKKLANLTSTKINVSNMTINSDTSYVTETVYRKNFEEKENLSFTALVASDVKVNVEANLLEKNKSVKNFSYEKLLKLMKFVKKPSDFWSITATSNFIIFANWNENYIPEKRIVIEKNLNVRVFLAEKEINVTGLVEITNFNDVVTLLQKAESY